MNARTNLGCWLIMSLFLFGFAVNAYGAGRELYVAGNGNDRNPGTEALPFRTINRACLYCMDRYGGLPVGGVTIWIRDGIYRETVRPVRSGTADAPIHFVAYPGEEPIVSGADILDVPWTLHTGKIYKAPTVVEFEQLFVDGQVMQEARWPNTSVRDLVRARHATCDNGTNDAVLIDDELPPGDWNDAYVHIRPTAEWDFMSKQIRNYKPGKSLEFSEVGWVLELGRRTLPGNQYWLFGSLAGLDRATEWFLDVRTHIVYLWCPGDPDPARRTIEVKRRDNAFDLSGCRHIRIEGLRVFAAGIVMKDSMHCSVFDCHLKYPLHRRIIPQGQAWMQDWKSNYMSGRYNEWKKTAIACSTTQGVYDLGDHNKVTNCIIHDWDLTSSGTSGIAASDAPFGEYTYNTICEGGGVGISLWTPFSLRVEHNHIYNISALSRDGMIIGVASTPDSGETVIAYNRLHDNLDKEDGDGLAGGGPVRDLKIHHNLVWNVCKIGIRMDSPEWINEVYNNTVFNCGTTFHFPYGEYLDKPPGVSRFINNIANGSMQYAGTETPEQHHNGYYLIDPNGWPTADSGAIDAGEVIPGITDGYVGSAPDIGCFEVGTEPWQAGADWVETDFTRIPSTEGFETGDFIEFDWAESPDWAITSEEKNSGFYSAQCSGLSAGEHSALEVMLRCRAGEITFYRKVSSHGAQVSLVLDIDGESTGHWSGELDWEQVSFPVTDGTHTFTWMYFKMDGSPTDDDAAWIDDIEFPIYSAANSEEPCFTRVSNTEGFEAGDFLQFGWAISSPGWAITSKEKNSGFYSAQCSGLRAEESGSALAVNVKCRAGEITFYRKVSSNGAQVGLVFIIDDEWTDPWSGEDWEQVSFPVTDGIHTFTWVYFKKIDGSPTDDDAAWIDDIEFPIYSGTTAEEPPVTRVSNTEGFETGDLIEFDWQSDGDVPWLVTSEEKYSGFYSAKSGSIDNDESSSLEVTLDCVLGEISFYYRVSSELGYDYLTFHIDGTEQDKFSGNEDWTQVSFPVKSGRRTFEWTYSKDKFTSYGSDTAWIDDIEFPID